MPSKPDEIDVGYVAGLEFELAYQSGYRRGMATQLPEISAHS
jgi:hypothetical protein